MTYVEAVAKAKRTKNRAKCKTEEDDAEGVSPGSKSKFRYYILGNLYTYTCSLAPFPPLHQRNTLYWPAVVQILTFGR